MTRLALVPLLAASNLLAASTSTPSQAGDTRELEGFVDGLMAAQKEAHHFAGSVAVIVRDGEVVFEKGYGYADFAARTPVDPRHTLFRVASNSKMFVWTAVMQLVEQGKLDLHVDVNQYLKGVQIPRTFPNPITLENLMTHTAGFEDKVIGLFTRTPDTLRPLAELMKRDMPRRVFPPGKVTAYSNYGATLAALIVEQVSGLPYRQYLKDRILDPLGMKYATIEQPLPAELAVNFSKGYLWGDGHLKEESFEYVPWAPCGAMSVSGEDMGRFMMAHLNDGVLGNARILRPETARVMREKLISFSPKINGMLHGFMEMNRNGETILGHGGDTIWFHSLTAMLPARHLGVFVAYNTDSGAAARDEFAEAFFDHLYPQPLAKETPPPREKRAALERELDRFIGAYTPARVSESDLTKISKLVTAVSVGVNAEGYLVTSGGGGFFPIGQWRQTEPLVFAEVDGTRKLVFRQDEHGQIADLCSSPICVVALEKEPWWNKKGVEFTWIEVCLAILVGAFIGFPIAAVLQRKQAKPSGAALARIAAWLASLAFIAGMAALSVGLKDPNEIVAGLPRAVRTAETIWVLGTVLAVLLIGFSITAWRRQWWRRTGRLCLTSVNIAAIGTIAWLYHWNLLG